MKHTSPIHVVYIITKLELGGAQKVCLSLFKGITDDSISAHLISGATGTLVDTIADDPRALLLEQMTREVHWFSIMHEARCFVTLVKTLKKIKREHPNLIVHTHSTKAGIMGRWAAWFAGVPQRVHTVHGYAFHDHQSYPTWFAIYCAELVTRFVTTHYICVSSADVKTGIRLFPGFRQNHSIIRAAIDMKPFYLAARPLTPTKPFVFGTIACFKPQKNIFDLLRAFHTVFQHNKNVRLEVIGDGAQRAAIEAWIEDHGLHKQITLHGWQEHVAPIMRSWHAFTLSSLWEGLPCAIVEARMLNLPVIAYDTGGIHDLIANGQNGFLVKKGEWRQLAHYMLTLTRDNNTYTALAQNQDHLHDFNESYMIDQHRSLYKNSMSCH